MIYIFNELIQEKQIKKLNTNDYIDLYKESYLKLNKDYDFYYKQYNEIKNITIQNTLEDELILYKDNNPKFYDMKNIDKIQTYFMKYCLLESLKLVIETKNKKDKELKKKIKSYKKKKYNYYPSVNDYSKYEEYIKEISLRKEFNIHQIPKQKENNCNSQKFNLAPHQLFLKNIFNDNTLYNGILIFHGVGVGKTCSGISIAENFKYIGKKTIILAPEKIQNGWNKNIFDPTKGKNQCTGDDYIYEEDKYEKNKEKLVSKRIKEYYEMQGYLSFSNSVKRYLEKNLKHIPEENILLRKEKEIELIDKEYSNRILIIDEVHNIRTTDKKSEKDTIHYIEKVLTHSNNLKLILLTANPMFNEPEEIIWILNMLLINDKKSKIDHKLTYDEDNNLSKESINIITEKSKGYISYLRGENPLTFPYRLYPNENKVKDNIVKDLFGNRLEDNNKLLFLELYGSELKGKQLKVYNQEIRKLNTTTLMDQETLLLQISNCVYPVDSENIEDLYGENGINNCFTKTGKKITKYSYKKNIPNFLDLDELSNYSCKIHNIIKSINESDGIIFIYSNYLDGGIVPLVLALEQNGYQKYDGNNVLNSKHKRDQISYNGNTISQSDTEFIPAKYSVIAGGSLGMSNNFKKELEIATCEENKDGKLIKIIIGSSVAAEGLDFKNIRAIHLLEPWHNINKLEQVIGRGIRNCSHVMLDPENRNITIYLHTTLYSQRETIETYLYRRCERKSKQIGQIELLLKKMAIDKYLFQSSNFIKKEDIQSITINPCKRDEETLEGIPYDKPYSRSCSFLGECDYIEPVDYKLTKKIFKKHETDTFSIKYSQPLITIYKDNIKEIIKKYYVLTFDFLINELKSHIQNLNIELIYHSLSQMINAKETININNTSGYLKFVDIYYLFQPNNNPDIFLPLYYRLNRGFIDKNEYKIDSKKEIKLLISKELEFEEEDIIQLYDKILLSDSYLSYTEEKVFLIQNKNKDNLFPKQIKYKYIIDRLKFKDKCILIYSLLIQLLEDIKLNKKYDEFNTILLDIFGPLFIYNNDVTANYEWYNKYDKTNLNKLYGCYIYWHERKEYIYYRYNSKKLYECNELQKRNIISELRKINKKQIYPNQIYGYIEYNKKYILNQSGLVLKIKRNKDRTGNIFISSSTSEWTSESGIKFIKKNFKDIWNNISSNDRENIELVDINGRYKINKLELSIIIELILRMENYFIQGDLVSYFQLKI